MKRFLAFSFSMMLTLAAAFPGTVALGEKKYVSIREIRETLPERWTGEYVVKNGAPKQLKKGDTVSVDVPIVVPEVDAVPVVRITHEPPVEGLDDSFEGIWDRWAEKGIGRNSKTIDLTLPLLEENSTFDPSLPWEDAPAIAMEEFQKWLPFMRGKELTPYFQRSYGDSETNGFQSIYFYTTYYGIPHLIVGGFRHDVKGEASPDPEKPTVPPSFVAMRIKRPGVFWANITSSREVGVDVEDIPLLPFEEILKVMEQRVVDGHAYMLNEVRFGYMVFIDPNKKGEEFVLLPVWAAKGRTRGDLKLPFDLKTDQAVVDRGGYSSSEIIVVNAQTGEVYDFAHDKRPDRRYVPHIITWDEVK